MTPAPALSLRVPSAQAEERQTDSAAAQRGTGIHFLLQRLSETRESVDSTLRTALHTRLNAVIAEPQYAEWLATARRVLAKPELARFFDSTRYRQAWNEVSVSGIASAESGVIDRLVDDGETLWVLDYKTHAAPSASAGGLKSFSMTPAAAPGASAGATPRDLADRYRNQLQAYASAVSQIWPGRPVRAGLVLTATQEWVDIL